MIDQTLNVAGECCDHTTCCKLVLSCAVNPLLTCHYVSKLANVNHNQHNFYFFFPSLHKHFILVIPKLPASTFLKKEERETLTLGLS